MEVACSEGDDLTLSVFVLGKARSEAASFSAKGIAVSALTGGA